jgi:hypothetical protein
MLNNRRSSTSKFNGTFFCSGQDDQNFGNEIVDRKKTQTLLDVCLSFRVEHL